MKKFKKVYLEITNVCNLNCSFCHKTIREKKFMSKEDFISILNKIDNHTDYLYFHVMGEPLLHPEINEFIDLASERFKVNITTNATLLFNIKTKNIRQINLSLHSLVDKNQIEDYFDTILKTINKMENTIINYRLWIKNSLTDEIINKLNDIYNTTINLKQNKQTLKNNVFLSFEEEFVWPDLNNNLYSNQGSCLALKDQIAILVDGTIVPCCLDADGIIDLGNIHEDNLENILNSDKTKKMIDDFQNKIKNQELCKHCNFYDNRKQSV